MRSDFAAITIASKAYISVARVTAGSFKEHHPDVPFYLLLTDEIDGMLDPRHEPFDGILSLDEVGVDQCERFRFQYGQQALSYAATPYAIDAMLNRGFGGVVFLKQETLVLDSLEAEISRTRQQPLALTPHYLEPPHCRNSLRWELNILLAGTFNGGVVFVSDQPVSRSFLAWWKSRMFLDSVCQVQDGYHYEQRWLDFAPSLVPGTRIIRDPGINVGHWNLADRDIRLQNGKLTACGKPCRVFRFSGYEPEHPERTSKYHPDEPVGETGDAAWAFERYRRLLMEADYLETRDWPYAYGRYDNGSTVTPEHRKAYRLLGEGVHQFGDPLVTSGRGSFWAWIESRTETARGLP